MKHSQRKYPKTGIIRFDSPRNTQPHYLVYAALLVFITPIICLLALVFGLGVGVIIIFCILSSLILNFIYQDIQLKSKKLAKIIVIGLPLMVAAIGYYF